MNSLQNSWRPWVPQRACWAKSSPAAAFPLGAAALARNESKHPPSRQAQEMEPFLSLSSTRKHQRPGQVASQRPLLSSPRTRVVGQGTQLIERMSPCAKVNQRCRCIAKLLATAFLSELRISRLPLENCIAPTLTFGFPQGTGTLSREAVFIGHPLRFPLQLRWHPGQVRQSSLRFQRHRLQPARPLSTLHLLR
jgi:hypothetical protein